MKKLYWKLRLKYEGSLVSKNMKLRRELKQYKKLLEETRLENHKLVDEITLKNIKIRELSLEKWMIYTYTN